MLTAEFDLGELRIVWDAPVTTGGLNDGLAGWWSGTHWYPSATPAFQVGPNEIIFTFDAGESGSYIAHVEYDGSGDLTYDGGIPLPPFSAAVTPL